MYLEHFAIEREPFELRPDPDMLYLSPTHREGLALLQYGVETGNGIVLLSGGVGTGKTTLVNVLTRSVQDSCHLCVLANPILDVDGFYTYFAQKIGLAYTGNKADFLLHFVQLLAECNKQGKKILLIIDEAHLLPDDLFVEIRMLSNFLMDNRKAMSIFLVGQPEVLERLADEKLLAVRQRIAYRFHLEPLSREDTLQYILFRLRAAGAKQPALFTGKAVESIHLASRGNPRVINVLCDNGLLTGYGRNLVRIDQDIIRECAEQQQLPGETKLFRLPSQRFLWQRWLSWLVPAALGLAMVGWLAVRFG